MEQTAFVQAYLVTGDTYTHRQEIKALGGKWNKFESGWLVPVSAKEAITALAELQGWVIDEIKVDAELLETPTGERLRAIRQDKIDRRVGRLLGKADRLQAEADKKSAARDPYRGDTAFWTQPGRIPARDRVMNSIETAGRLASEAKDVRDKAIWLSNSGARVAGDAEIKRQAKRDHNDTWVTAGMNVNTYIYGFATIVKVNKKTYTIRTHSGFETTVDKSFVAPIK